MDIAGRLKEKRGTDTGSSRHVFGGKLYMYSQHDFQCTGTNDSFHPFYLQLTIHQLTGRPYRDFFFLRL